MIKRYKGRVVVPGDLIAEALVTHTGFNTLANLKTAGSFLNPRGILQDMNNPELYGKRVPGRILCLPETIGSTTGGMALYTVCASGMSPACLLFSKHIDSLAAAGAVLADIWTDTNMPVVDKLGEEFLNYVKDGMTVEVKENGIVEVSDD